MQNTPLDVDCSYNFATLFERIVAHSAPQSKSHMPRDKTLRVRLNQREFDKIQLLAQQHDVPMSEVVRDLIKQLPEPLTGVLAKSLSKSFPKSMYANDTETASSMYASIPIDLKEV